MRSGPCAVCGGAGCTLEEERCENCNGRGTVQYPSKDWAYERGHAASDRRSRADGHRGIGEKYPEREKEHVDEDEDILD